MDEYTVAIVDDEIHAVHHLQRMLEANLPDCRVAGSYLDPVQALRELKHRPVDILFLDIMMPAVNGLDFAREYLRACPRSAVILLTAYRDFSFAQKAVDIGVCRYWVKHELRPASISAMMEEVKQEVRRAGLLHHSMEVQTVLEILSGQADFSRLAPEGCSNCFLLYLRGWDEAGLPPQEIGELEEALRGLSIGARVDLTGMAVTVGTAVCIGWECEPGGYRRLRNVLEGWVREKGVSVILGEPFEVAAYQAWWHRRYMAGASNLLVRQTGLLTGGPDEIELLLPDRLPFPYLEEVYLAPLEQALGALEAGSAQESLRRLWQDPHLQAGNWQAVRYVCGRLEELFTHLCGEMPRFAGQQERLRERLRSCALLELEEFYRGWLEQAISPQVRGGAAQSMKVRQISAYIRSHYHEDLKLKALTGRFNISGDYLRKLFKSETGQTISEYITQVRIEQAKRLLQTGNYKIYEIADLVGYRSAQYFSQAFYNATGHYPTEDRKAEPAKKPARGGGGGL